MPSSFRQTHSLKMSDLNSSGAFVTLADHLGEVPIKIHFIVYNLILIICMGPLRFSTIECSSRQLI